MRWLLARAPEAGPVDADESVAGTAELAEPGQPAAEPVHATTEKDADVAVEALAAEVEADRPAQARTGRFARVFGRRADKDDDGEAFEHFALPEPDESFARPWLRPPDEPAPTRNWTRSRRAPMPRPPRPAGNSTAGNGAAGNGAAADSAVTDSLITEGPVAAGPAADSAAAESPVADHSAVEPLAGPGGPAEFEPTTEPAIDEPAIAQPSEHSADAEPAPTSAAGDPRASGPHPSSTSPRPGTPVRPATPEPAHRPSPGAPKAASRRPGPGSAPTPEAAPPSARPAPGPGRKQARQNDRQNAPRLGIAGASTPPPESTLRPDYRPPDLSKFLEATEPKLDDDGSDDQHEKRRPRAGSRWRRFAVRTLIVAVIAAVAALVLRAFVVQPYYIPSESMEPTLHGCAGCTDDHVLVDKLTYRAQDARVGDIVVFHRPKNANTSEKVLIKRVIALPGDTIQLRDGHVFVNGNLVDEPYVNKKCGSRPTLPLNGTSTWRVPGNDLFVMGDNRCNSYDSRAFGPIPESSVIGRAFMIIWPLDRVTVLGH